VFYETFYRIHLERLSRCRARRLAGALRRLGCYVAVVSNKVGENLRAELAHLGWERWIKRAVGARTACATNPRPIPSTSRSTARELPLTYGMDGRRHPGDLKCAHAAGVLPVYFGSVESCRSGCWNSAAPSCTDCHDLAALL
jgi:phosphoglycolate phosphatase